MENNNNKTFETLLPDNKISENSLFLIHRSLITQIKNKKKRLASTKTRSEVKGGGRKPWKQKGTGNARAGSNTSPLWKGGGVIFGPKPRDIQKKINRKEKQLALKYILYSKNNQTRIIDNFNLFCSSFKTNYFLKNLKNLQLDENKKLGIILPFKNKNLYLATRNLKNVKLLLASSLNVKDLLGLNCLITTNETIETIKHYYSKV